MTTPEGRIKNMVKALLKKHKPHVWAFWPVQTGYGRTTLDCIGCAYGYPFSIETKAPGKTMTPRQEDDARDMLLAGVRVFLIDNREKMAVLQAFLDNCETMPTSTYNVLQKVCHANSTE